MCWWFLLPILALSHSYFFWLTGILSMFCILNLWCYMFNLYCHGVRGLFHFVVFSSTEILNVIEFSSIFLYDVYFYILNPLLRIMKISLMFSAPCFAVLLFILKYLIYVTLIILFSLIRCGVVWPVILERLTNESALFSLIHNPVLSPVKCLCGICFKVPNHVFWFYMHQYHSATWLFLF